MTLDHILQAPLTYLRDFGVFSKLLSKRSKYGHLNPRHAGPSAILLTTVFSQNLERPTHQ